MIVHNIHVSCGFLRFSIPSYLVHYISFCTLLLSVIVKQALNCFYIVFKFYIVF